MLWLIGQERRIVSEAARTLGTQRPEFSYEQIDVPRADSARQFAWVMRRDGSDEGPWALFLHGNAGTIASNVSISRYRVLRAAGLNLLAPEYRGFAGLDGVATEASLIDDARAAYEYLRDTRHVAEARIAIYGWSLGAAVAADVASDASPAAVILEAAPASLVDITQERYPFFPIRLLMPRQFETIRTIDRVRAPLLFLHSKDDVVVPIAQGRRLFEAARAEKAFVEVRGGHLDAPEADAAGFTAALSAFLKRHGI